MTTILQDLETLLGADFRSKLDNNPGLKAKVEEADRIYGIYTEGSDETDAAAEAARLAEAKKVADAAEKARIQSAAAAHTAQANQTGSEDLKAVLAQLTELKTKMDKDYVSRESLPSLEQTLLSRTIRLADEIGLIRERNLKELGEPLDLTKFDNWYVEKQKAGMRFPSVTSAYEEMTKAQREEKTIAARVEEALKQKRSSESIPAVSSQPAQSPALELIQKSKKAAGDGQSAVMAAAARLKAAREAREGSAAAS